MGGLAFRFRTTRRIHHKYDAEKSTSNAPFFGAPPGGLKVVG